MSLQQLENEVNAIKEVNQEAGNELHKQLHHAMNAKWSRSDLSDYIKSDNDVVIEFNLENKNPLLIDDVRNVQDGIIKFFGEDEDE